MQMTSNGRLDVDSETGAGIAGARAFIGAVPWVFDSHSWRHVQDLHDDVQPRSGTFMSAPGPLQSTQRAEKVFALLTWALTTFMLLMALVGYWIGVLVTLREVWSQTVIFFNLFCRMLPPQELDTVVVTQVKGHASDHMVEQHQVPSEDIFGNDQADRAATVSGKLQNEAVLNAKSALVRARKDGILWCWLCIASHITVNNKGGGANAPDHTVCDKGVVLKRRRVDFRVSVSLATTAGTTGFGLAPGSLKIAALSLSCL